MTMCAGGCAMARAMSVAEAKSRFSELVNRASYGRERFLIRKRGKPVGAIVSAEDLERLEAAEPRGRPGGALATVGALAEFEEWEGLVDEVVRGRAQQRDREVDL